MAISESGAHARGPSGWARSSAARSPSLLLHGAVACSAALICLLCLGPRAAGQDAGEKRLAQVLSGYEKIPGESYWKKRGPETVALLQALYADDRQPAFVRLRAVRAASFYRTPRAREFLLSVARKRGQKELFVREALLGLARAFKQQAGNEIASFLDHEKPLVRRAAAEALGAIKAEAYRSLLVRRLQRERDGAVRAALEQALQQTPDRVQK
jgi:HEAT repeat protein